MEVQTKTDFYGDEKSLIDQKIVVLKEKRRFLLKNVNYSR